MSDTNDPSALREDFRSQAAELFEDDDVDGLRDLLARFETEPAFREEAWLALVRGVLAREDGRLEDAERAFASAMEAAEHDAEAAALAFDERLSLRWIAGDLSGAYAELEPQADVLRRLIALCAEAEDVEGVAELLDRHAADGRPHGSFPEGEVLVQLHRGEDAAALERLQAERAALCAAWGVSDWESRTVACLVRLGRPDEALALAKAACARDGDPWLEAWVHIRERRAEAALSALGRWVEDGWGSAALLWIHEALWADLHSEALEAVRATYPQPDAET